MPVCQERVGFPRAVCTHTQAILWNAHLEFSPLSHLTKCQRVRLKLFTEHCVILDLEEEGQSTHFLSVWIAALSSPTWCSEVSLGTAVLSGQKGEEWRSKYRWLDPAGSGLHPIPSLSMGFNSVAQTHITVSKSGKWKKEWLLGDCSSLSYLGGM